MYEQTSGEEDMSKLILFMMVLGLSSCALTPKEKRAFAIGLEAFNCGTRGGVYNEYTRRCRLPKKVKCVRTYDDTVECTEVL